MARTKHRPSYRDIAVAAALVFGILWFGWLTWGIIAKEERARVDVNDTKAQLASLDAREATLQHDLDELNTPRGKEAALRDTLGVAKPGEDVIIVVPPVATTTATTTGSWWQSVLDWF